jgi:hypothetical protein
MSVKFYELFNNIPKIKIDEIKWIPPKKIDNFIYKNSLIENTLKHPLCESRDNKNYEETWNKILETYDISIENFNNTMHMYDQKTRNIIKNIDKKGYIIKAYKTLTLYSNEQVTILKMHDNDIFIYSSILKEPIFNLIPIFYTLKFNLYNLFFIGTSGPIEYFDYDLNDTINKTLKNTNSIKDAIFYFVNLQNNDAIEYQLICNYYYGNKHLNNELLKKYINRFENNISRIVKDRNDLYKQIKKLDDEIKIVDEKNKSVLKKIGELNNFINESNNLRKLPESKTKQTKIDKFLKEHTEIFIEYTKTEKKVSVEQFITNKINDLYETIINHPTYVKKERQEFVDILNNDIIDTYKIAINYFLIMICISLSDDTLESIYEGNLINKAVFDVKELKDLIEMINKNLLY